MRPALAAGLGALLVACGGGTDGGGEASLWITRDRGARVLAEREVPAGLTALQALDRVADVDTRYGGRFVQAVNGIRGSLVKRRDWFYFVNGYEADRSAAEYRVRDGDVVWWDLRSWADAMREPVVVGAFPEPFLHGFDGDRRRAAVRYGDPQLARAARAIARVIRASSVAPARTPAPRNANLLLLLAGRQPRFEAALRAGSTAAGDPVVFTFVGDAMRLARNPDLARFRYRWRPSR